MQEMIELDRGESQSSIAISEEASLVEEQISVPAEDIDLYAAVIVVDTGGNRSALGPDSVAGPVRAVGGGGLGVARRPPSGGGESAKECEGALCAHLEPGLRKKG